MESMSVRKSRAQNQKQISRDNNNNNNFNDNDTNKQKIVASGIYIYTKNDKRIQNGAGNEKASTRENLIDDANGGSKVNEEILSIDLENITNENENADLFDENILNTYLLSLSSNS